GWEIRAFLPGAQRAFVAAPRGLAPMERLDDRGLFVRAAAREITTPYRLIQESDGVRHEAYDPYSFAPQLTDHDLHLFNEGRLFAAQRTLGAHPTDIDGVRGVRFAVWAPNAERVSVVGDFNAWDGRRHAKRSRGNSGVWEIFIPGVEPLARYKFELRT